MPRHKFKKLLEVNDKIPQKELKERDISVDHQSRFDAWDRALKAGALG